MKLWIKILFVFLLFALTFSNQKIEARSGCCSHHGGVCGCGCCDGSGLSSTCAPYYPECSGPSRIVVPTSKPIPTSKPRPTLKPSIIPTQKPIFTIRPSSTPKPTEIVSLTKIPSITPSPLPTKSATPAVVNVSQTKPVKSQSIFSRFFNWLFNWTK